MTAGLAAGYKKFVGVPGATYKVAITNATALVTLSGTNGITFDLANSVIDNSATSYTSDLFTSVFLIDGAVDTTVLLGKYLGFPLPTPATHLGYRGATLVRAINGAKGVKVEARADHLRYGVQSGEYGDATKGGCSDFDITLRGTMIGYPIALYRADNVRHDLDVDGVHRIAYVAGTGSVQGTAAFRDQYIAPIAYLITNALTGGTDTAAQADPIGAATTSRGSHDVKVKVIDKGSTIFQNGSACAGIALSRVDPCAFENIDVEVYTKGTDTLSTRMGGFHLISGDVPGYWSRYPYSWEQSIVLDNIRIRGVVDHSAQTLPSNTTGELYITTKDDAGEAGGHYATVRGLNIDGLTILKSAAVTPRSIYVLVREPIIPIRIRGLNAPGLDLILHTSTAIPTLLDGSVVESVTLSTLGTGSLLHLGAGTQVSKKVGSLPVNSNGGRIGGGGGLVKHKETPLTLSGASTTWAAAIPAGSLLLGVQGRIGSAIGGATGYLVGITGDTDRFANRNDTASGLVFNPGAQAADQTTLPLYLGDTAIVVTAKASNFTSGTMRPVLTYVEFASLTSA